MMSKFLLRSIVVSCSNSFLKQRLAKTCHALRPTTFRTFSTTNGVGKDPPRMITFEEEETEMEEGAFPFLREHVREEIYKKHKEDPAEWTLQKLAMHYKASLPRVKGIIILFNKRENLMRDKGVLEISPEWQQMWEKHKEFIKREKLAASDEIDVKTIAEKVGVAEKVVEKKREEMIIKYSSLFIAEETGTELKEVETCLTNMKWHFETLEEMAQYVRDEDEWFNELEQADVDTSFRESFGGTQASRNFDFKYFPELIGDDEMASRRRYLLRTLTNLTKATLNMDAERFLANEEKHNAYPIDPSKVVEGKLESRWKYAFKDISKEARASQVPTMIRTRTGGWREATPLEECKRSWVRRITPMDWDLNKHRFTKWEDPDRDEERAKLIPIERLQRRKELKASKGAK